MQCHSYTYKVYLLYQFTTQENMKEYTKESAKFGKIYILEICLKKKKFSSNRWNETSWSVWLMNTDHIISYLSDMLKGRAWWHWKKCYNCEMKACRNIMVKACGYWQ